MNPAWHEKPNTVLLDTAKPDRENHRSLLFTDPVEVLQISRPADLPRLLEQIERRVDSGYHAAGYIHYECGQAFESVTDAAPSVETDSDTPPPAWFGIYDEPREVSSGPLVNAAAAEVDEPTVGDARFSLRRPDYNERFERIKHHIREGDVYQINFTGHVQFDYAGAPVALYRRLRSNQRVPYGAFLRTSHETILCLSPELFFRREGNEITARPMKGTIRRGRTLEEDLQLRRRLADDEKSRAENLMIVDLLRNDLSRVAQPTSVNVSSMFSTETYDTVTQMTSTVTARLRANTTYRDLFRALFPCGSVTGAPKVRAMQLIHRLEPEPRGIYCGSIGYISPDRRAAFNVAIRTVVLRNGRGRMGTGSGIVWDSDNDLEYEECTLKTEFLTRSTPDFHLIESILWADEYRLLERHLDRIERSARYFAFPFSRAAIRDELEKHERQLRPGTTYKIRLCLHDTGSCEVSHARIETEANEPWMIRIAEPRIDAANRYRYHKTSQRKQLDELHCRAADEGYDEIVFLNTRGEVTEGSRSNIFIRRGDTYLTPPVGSGLLPGVYRSYLLDTLTKSEEQVLYPEDLETADDIYLCNAIRGMCSARLIPRSERLNV